MSNLIDHAKAEFKALGYIPLDQEQEESPNKWIQENVLELIEVFAKQGHSGSSAHFCIEYFRRLASFEPLSPIQCTDDEWTNVHGETYQNKRLSSVFKEEKTGNPYYIYAIVWRDQNGGTFTSNCVFDNKGNQFSSFQYIKLPFYPKTFYVDVISKEVAPDDWESYIKDESQLKEVFEYYDRKI